MADTGHSLSDSGLGQAVRALTRKGDRLASRKKNWVQYLKKIGDDVTRIEKNTALKDLIRREGIPPEHRGKVWIHLTGIREKCSSDVLTYADLVTTFEGQTSEHTIQIDKDLKRTFPDSEGEDHEETIQALRRVLVSYSWLNPEIGYCQSMNFITALFLLFMDEEEAFWLLKTTVEDILPQDYYTRSMLGVRVDEFVLSELLNQKLPKIAAHIEEVGMPLSSIVTPWFMCLFINILPLECTLRFFDSLFVEGSKMLFRVALALFKVNSRAILAAEDFDTLFMFLKSLGDSTDASVLMEAAFNKDWMGSMPGAKIQHLRQSQHSQLLRSALEEKQRWEQQQQQQEGDDPPTSPKGGGNGGAVVITTTTADQAPPPSPSLSLSDDGSDDNSSGSGSDLTPGEPRPRAQTANTASGARRPPPARGGSRIGATAPSPRLPAKKPLVAVRSSPGTANRRKSPAVPRRQKSPVGPRRVAAGQGGGGAGVDVGVVSPSPGARARGGGSAPGTPGNVNSPSGVVVRGARRGVRGRGRGGRGRGRGMPRGGGVGGAGTGGGAGPGGALPNGGQVVDTGGAGDGPTLTAPGGAPAPSRPPRVDRSPRLPRTGRRGRGDGAGGFASAATPPGSASPSPGAASRAPQDEVIGGMQNSLSEVDTRYQSRFRPLSVLVANRRRTNELFANPRRMGKRFQPGELESSLNK